MQRIFKYGGIQNIILNPDKELNILIYRMPSYVIIWKSYALQKMVRFFWPTLYILNSTISPWATRRLRHANDVSGFHPLISWLADDYKYEVSMRDEKVSNKISKQKRLSRNI